MLSIEPFLLSDFETLIKWIDSPEASEPWAHKTYPFPLDNEIILSHWLKTKNSPQKLFIFKILACSASIGHVEIELVSNVARVCRFFIAPAFRGKGHGKVALKKILDFSFSSLLVDEAVINVFESNNKAICLYKNAGFKQRDKNLDSYTMSLSALEFSTAEMTLVTLKRTFICNLIGQTEGNFSELKSC